MYGIKPQKPAPDLIIDSLDQAAWRLSEQTSELFTMIVFYRGLFCPTCRDYLGEVHGKLPEFEKRGVGVLAASMDGRGQAEQSRSEWELPDLNIAYGLSVEEATQWGLFVTGHRNPQGAQQVFSEPGLFLIRPDRSIYSVFLQSSEFARPDMGRILTAIDYVAASKQ